MKFLLRNERVLKSGLNLDYFFKALIFYTYKLTVGNHFFYIVDKFLAEKLFFITQNFFKYISSLLLNLKSLNFNQILKISIIIGIQVILLYLL